MNEREILFRGKNTRYNCWEYGFYTQFEPGHPCSGTYNGIIHYIYNISGNPTDVEPETVGQFTGEIDKNGVKIFEGDILDHFATYGYVIFGDGMFSMSSSAKVNFGYRQPLCYLDSDECEIVGNIFDNPELLEESL